MSRKRKLSIITIVIAATILLARQPETIIRQGVAAIDNEPQCFAGKQWRMSWSPNTQSTGPCFQHVPMLASKNDRTMEKILQTAQEVSGLGHTYLTLYNECNDAAQCATAIIPLVDYLHEIVVTLEENELDNIKLIVGGSNTNCLWLREFRRIYIERWGPIPKLVAGWHFHLYPEVIPLNTTLCKTGVVSWTGDPSISANSTVYMQAWKKQLDQTILDVALWNNLDEREYELWLTEIGCLICPNDTTFMNTIVTEILTYLNCNSCLGKYITRYAWYSDQPDFLCNNVCSWPQTYLHDHNNGWHSWGIIYRDWNIIVASPLPDYIMWFPRTNRGEIGYP